MNEIGPPTIEEYLNAGGKWKPWYDFYLPREKRRGVPFVHYIPIFKSVLVKDQKKDVRREVVIDGKRYEVHLRLQYDDEKNNGHNTFSVLTAGYRIDENDRKVFEFSGMPHNEAQEYFHEYSYLFKWHLCSPNGPLQYITNTVYHARQGELERAKQSAIFNDWEDVSLKELQDEEFLLARLPKLIYTFKLEIESIGFTF